MALLRLDLRLLGKDATAWRRMFTVILIVLTGIFLWNNRQSAPSFTLPEFPRFPSPAPRTDSPAPAPPTPVAPISGVDPAAAADLRRRLDAVEKELRSLSDRSSSSATATSTLEKKLQKLQEDLGATQKRVDDDASALKQLNAFAGKDGTLAKEQSSLAAANAKLAADHTKLAGDHSNLAKEHSNLASQQATYASQQAKLRDELASLSKDISERLKAESTARAELAAELQRFKAAAPGAKEEAEEKLRARIKALVTELLPNQALAPATSAVPAPTPVREFKLQDHRDALEALIKEVLKRDSPELFSASFTSHKNTIQIWAQEAVAPDIRRLDARDRELEKLRTAALEPAPMPVAPPSPAATTGTGVSEARIADLIDAALERFAADRLALPDYALESAGASIVRWRTSAAYRSASWFATPRPLGPSVALQPDVAVGRCFAFAGSQGNITIRLAAPVAPTAVSIEHVSRHIAHDIDSAPRDFIVWGMKQETDDDEKLTKLGHFTYDIKSNHAVQTFSVKAADGALFSYVLLQILSNHGHDAYTCLYRFRVHGKEME